MMFAHSARTLIQSLAVYRDLLLELDDAETPARGTTLGKRLQAVYLADDRPGQLGRDERRRGLTRAEELEREQLPARRAGGVPRAVVRLPGAAVSSVPRRRVPDHVRRARCSAIATALSVDIKVQYRICLQTA
jgi:hypothetical protein